MDTILLVLPVLIGLWLLALTAFLFFRGGSRALDGSFSTPSSAPCTFSPRGSFTV